MIFKRNNKYLRGVPLVLLPALLLGAFMFGALPAARGAEVAVVQVDVANIRSGPSTGSNLLTQAGQAQQLPVLAKSGDWYQVQLPNGSSGWIAGWLTVLKQDNSTGESKKVVVAENVLNVRSGPGTGNGIVGQVYRGNVLTVLEEAKDWYRVSLPAGSSGWVAAWLVIRQPGAGSTAGGGTAPAVPGPTAPTAPAAPTAPVATPPATASNVGKTAVIADNVVNIRSGPGTDNPVVKVAYKGQSMVVLQQTGDWYRVKLQNGVIGWVAAWLVTLGPAQTIAPPQVTPPKETSLNEITVSRGSQETTLRPTEPKANPSPNPSSNSNSNPNSSSNPNSNSSQNAGQTAKVNGMALALNINSNGDKTTVALKADTALSYRVHYLNNPNRLVVDLEGIKPGNLSPDKMVNTKALSRVRLGQFQSDPLVTRMVLELSNGAICVDNLSADQKTLTVEAIVPNVSGAYRGRSVTIDPGHGGGDPGAIGKNGTKEKDLTLDIAKQARDLLTAKGARVTMSRSNDKVLDLYEIADIANTARTDIFVSIHINASTNRASNGTSTYLHRSVDQPGQNRISESDKLARCVQNELLKSLGLQDRGVLEANFAVLRTTNMPAILVEVAFISNGAEEQLLLKPDFRRKAAEAIVNGIGVYFAVNDAIR